MNTFGIIRVLNQGLYYRWFHHNYVVVFHIIMLRVLAQPLLRYRDALFARGSLAMGRGTHPRLGAAERNKT